MKKVWVPPQLTIHGPVDKITQIAPNDVIEMGELFLIRESKGLLASLSGM